jgi:hypothetical protein
MKILYLAVAMATAPAAAQSLDPVTVSTIEAVCFDYVDGQLDGGPVRVARALHPDLAKRAAVPANAEEALALRRMSRDELVALTRNGVLKTPRGSACPTSLATPRSRVSKRRGSSTTSISAAGVIAG